jgi:hypothetical protein
VIPYLRLLALRTRRAYLPITVLVPLAVPVVMFTAGLVARGHARDAHRGLSEAFVGSTVLGIFATLLAVANLTAFLVDDERRGARALALRLATVDGRPPVAAHQCLASGLAAATLVSSLALPTLVAAALGLAPLRSAAAVLAAAAGVTAAGPVGLWLGYLLPRVAALVAVQFGSFLAGVGVLKVAIGIAEGDVDAGAVLLGLLALLALHGATLLALPPLWRRTSGRLW